MNEMHENSWTVWVYGNKFDDFLMKKRYCVVFYHYFEVIMNMNQFEDNDVHSVGYKV